MSDDSAIRKTNLRKLGKSAAELAKLKIGGYSYWAALLPINSKKSFGEKKARELEAMLHLRRGAMDEIWDAPPEALERATLSPMGREVGLALDSALPDIDRNRLSRLDAFYIASQVFQQIAEGTFVLPSGMQLPLVTLSTPPAAPRAAAVPAPVKSKSRTGPDGKSARQEDSKAHGQPKK